MAKYKKWKVDILKSKAIDVLSVELLKYCMNKYRMSESDALIFLSTKYTYLDLLDKSTNLCALSDRELIQKLEYELNGDFDSWAKVVF